MLLQGERIDQVSRIRNTAINIKTNQLCVKQRPCTVVDEHFIFYNITVNNLLLPTLTKSSEIIDAHWMEKKKKKKKKHNKNPNIKLSVELFVGGSTKCDVDGVSNLCFL